MKLLDGLEKRKLIHPPPWLNDNLQFMNIHGSELYGCATDTSDKDIYGICLPPLTYLFPHIEGYIHGFNNPPSFDSWIQHHVKDGDTTYDFQIFNITKFLRLAIEGNPNILECLFAPLDCILHQTQAMQPILDIKCELLTQRTLPRFRGYAVSQLHKMKSKDPIGKRKDRVDEFGFDVKFASHTVRLLLFAEQILTERYIDVRRDREMLKSIKRGDWSIDKVIEFAQNKMLHLDKLVQVTKLPTTPNEEKIRQLLIEMIENHYGRIDSYVALNKTDSELKIEQIKKILA